MAALLVNLGSSTGMKEVLNEIPLDGKHFEDLIYELELQGRRDVSLCVLFFQSSQNRELSHHFCSEYIKLLIWKKCPIAHLLQFLQAFEQRQWSLNPAQLYALGHYIMDQGEMGLAIEMLRGKDSSQSETAMFNRLIGTCIATKRFDQAATLYTEMQKQSIPADVNTYAALMTGCARQKDDVRLFELFCEMRQHSIEPDLYIYNLCIRSCERRRDGERGMDLYAEMCGKGVMLNSNTYKLLIQLCGKRGWTSKARALFDEMQESPQKPSRAVINSLLEAYARSDNPEETFALFDQLRSKEGFHPDALTITTLCHACLGMTDLARIVPKLRGMRKQGVVLDHVSHNAALDVCALSGDAETALLLMQEMQLAGMKPNPMTRDVLIRVLIQSAAQPPVWALLEEFKRCGYVLNVDAYNAIFSSCEALGDDIKEVIKWAQRMTEDGIAPNGRTYAILISAAGSRKEMTLAKDWFRTMQSDAHSESLTPYIAYIHACSRWAVYDEGLAAFQALRQHSLLKPDARSYETMVKLSVNAGRLTEAQALLDEMRQLGWKPDQKITQLLESAQEGENSHEQQNRHY